VWLERDIEIEVAIAPALEPLATFSRQPQSLTVDGTGSDARLHGVRYTPQAAGGVVFRHGERQR
jgi:hypothetical protein